MDAILIIYVHAHRRDTFHRTDIARGHNAAHVSHVIILGVAPMILFVGHLVFVVTSTLVVPTILRALILIEMTPTLKTI